MYLFLFCSNIQHPPAGTYGAGPNQAPQATPGVRHAWEEEALPCRQSSEAWPAAVEAAGDDALVGVTSPNSEGGRSNQQKAR